MEEMQRDLAREYSRLLSEIERHDRLYYLDDAPEISDHAYDRLMEELRRLERRHPEIRSADSPAGRVAGGVATGFTEVIHPEPMLSLANAFSRAEAEEWYQRARSHTGTRSRLEMAAEPKIDGLAVRLHYEDGRLTLAATRGDGTKGENVTANARTVHNLPLKIGLTGILDVRGEIYIPRSRFEELNREREERGEIPYSNPRNAAAGAMRQLDHGEAGRRGLHVWIYSLDGEDRSDHLENLSRLEELGLPVNPLNRRCCSMEDIEAYYQEMLETKDGLDYGIDGIVLKVCDMALQRFMGTTGREPRWATAWKFPNERAETMLRDIIISPSRFGRLTPVAVLNPVEIGGVSITSASLHSEADIRRKDIRRGEMVVVERAGDVIPQVTGPADTDRRRDTPEFSMPVLCPFCHSPAMEYKDEAGHWCADEDCPSRLPERLRHFVSRRCMDIEHAGPQLCDALVGRGLVHGPEDLYLLTKEQLVGLEGFGERSAAKLLESIERSRENPLERVLYSLGIFRLGREVSGLLAQRYESVEEIAELTEEQLTSIPGIGPRTARSVVEGMRTERVRRTIAGLGAAGVRVKRETDGDQDMRGEKYSMTQVEEFAGKNCVVTGKIEGMTRAEAEDLIREMGGRVGSSVTANTDVLVVGEKPGSKLEKARSLRRAQIMDNAEFQRILAGAA